MGPTGVFVGYSLFLFAPRFTREHPDQVQSWIERAASHPADPADRDIGLKRIGMIAAHDTLERLPAVSAPTLVICGDQNHCTPLPLSEEIAHGIKGAELVVLKEGGELIELELAVDYHRAVAGFIGRHV